MKKVIFISHPIAGDVMTNLAKIQNIIHDILLKEPDVIPQAPYFVDALVLDDTNKDQRIRGLNNALYLINEIIYDEIRLYGGEITNGMMDEIKAGIDNRIPIRPMTVGTYDMFENLFPGYNINTKDDAQIIEHDLLNQWQNE